MKWILSFGVCWFLILGQVGAKPSKRSGLHDFRAADFEQGRTYLIDSSWSFYWKHLIQPDRYYPYPIDSSKFATEGRSSWTLLTQDSTPLPSFGYGTYITDLILPKHRASLSLKVPKINSSCKIWINKTLVFEAGNVGKSKETTLNRRIARLIPIESSNDTVRLTIQVANFYHRYGGLVAPVILGDTSFLWENERLEIISDMILIGSLMFLGLALLILYNAYWGYDKAILYLSIFSLCWGYRVLSDNYAILPYLFDSMSWVVHVKIEYLSLLLGSIMGFLFLKEIFGERFSEYFIKVNTGVFVLLASLIIVCNSYYLFYLLISFFVIVTINVLYAIYVIVSSKQTIPSLFALAGILTGITVLLYNIYSFNVLGQSNTIWINIGYLFAFMMNSLLLGKRFSVTFFRLNKLQKETQLQNDEIGRQAKLINETNDQLEEKVKERTKEIEKVLSDLKERNNNLEQFNYIVSHNMRAPVSNIIGLVNVYNKKDVNDPFNNITINKLEESIQALDQVLKDLTSILEARHHVQGPPETVYFDHLIKEILKSISKEIESSHLVLDLNFQVESIKSNGAYWHSIFINLITNAIKYKKLGEPADLRISSWIEGSYMKLTFEDKGLGIDLSENGSGIFGLYKRFHSHIDGKGMGLYMVKTQVQSLGGNITVDSKPNIGTKFTITMEL